ncbi:MAG TPA: hypothetical protein VMU39_25235 [Solirubrobacteraceae bacterium]|nr:hypothetical protein [Solirubrobacteraceae bacterium]
MLAGEHQLDERFADASGRDFLGLRAVCSSSDSSDPVKAADLWDASERLVASAAHRGGTQLPAGTGGGRHQG